MNQSDDIPVILFVGLKEFNQVKEKRLYTIENFKNFSLSSRLTYEGRVIQLVYPIFFGI